MQLKQTHILCCPRCQGDLDYVETARDGQNEVSLRCSAGHSYAVVDGIPRFVPAVNYADSFGRQWKQFSQVQLDSYNGTGYSEQRFRRITGWSPDDLRGKLVLDAGCGAGRFAEISAKFGADLVGVDLSQAVEVCQENLHSYDALVCQSSIYELPFHPGSFDIVYCIGVIQHTPDPLASIRALCQMVKPGGRIGLWIYERNWKSFIGTLGFKYALRPITKRMSWKAQVRFVQFLVNLCYPLITVANRMGLLGKIMMRLLPTSSADLHAIGLREEDLKTWIFLDTLDMYSPAYDTPLRYDQVSHLLAAQGFEQIQRQNYGGISITARRTSGSV